MKNVFALFFLFASLPLFAQEMSTTGRVVDKDGSALSFVTVLLYEEGGSSPIKGAITEEDGTFTFTELPRGDYSLQVSMVGFQSMDQDFNLPQDSKIPDLILLTNREELEQVTVNARKPTIERSPGKLTFIVENTALASGSAVNVLQKTPGVLMLTETVTIKNKPATIYINDRRLYMSEGQIYDYLQSLDASVIKAIDVITNPSARYDAEAGVVLNIQTTKSVSVGYKGSVNATFEQAVFPKYALGTTQFYKNKWLDFFGSYNVGLRKENKDQEDFIRWFDSNIPSDTWETDFNRVTDQTTHQINLVADMAVAKGHALSLSANMYLLPDQQYDIRSHTDVYNVESVLDSSFVVNSGVANTQHNLSFALGYTIDLTEDGDRLKLDGNYIDYKDTQDQDVSSDYFLPDGMFIRNNSFTTEAEQLSSIYTAEINYLNPSEDGAFELGGKYSNIDTESQLLFFDANISPPSLDPELTDRFNYKESIYAAYASYEHQWEKWTIEFGLRVEHTDVEGISLSLGEVNNRNYTEWFPTASFTHQLENEESIGLTYTRRIARPRYQSLNPFRYFLNDFNFNSGNPNLVPAITNRVTFSYSIKNRWFFDLYYEHTDNSLSILTFQDNDTRTKRYLDANLIMDQQYSLDLTYFQSIAPWWYLSTYNSLFYLENEFFAEESRPETYSNSTWGFYNQLYNSFKLSKDQSWSADLTSVFFSNYIYGSYTMKNQYSLSLAVQKKLWDDKARITLGVDDIFNTNNIRWTSRYYNQDNSYFPMPESRMFRLTFKYNFGNVGLSDNNRSNTSKEADRLQKN